MNVFQRLFSPLRAAQFTHRINRREAHLEELEGKRFEVILATIGALSLTWAMLEDQLDLINELAFLNGAKDVVDAQVPRALERKLRFFRKCHNKVPWLADLIWRVAPIADRITAVSDSRHQIIHGVSQNLYAPPDAYIFVRNTHGPDGLGKVVKEFREEDFMHLAREIREITQALREHHGAMNDALLEDRRRYLGS